MALPVLVWISKAAMKYIYRLSENAVYFEVSTIEITTDCKEININSLLPEFLLLND